MYLSLSTTQFYVLQREDDMPVLCNQPYGAVEAEDQAAMEAHFARFPFPLSDFQKYAIQAIVRGQHALVCAPTGSGKTLPAEFAIDYFTARGKKVIYTSPIKALSNQKYYEFSAKFPHLSIGLCTGDIKTNPSADVLIMTAEILNNRLFQLKREDVTSEKEGSAFGLSFEMDLERELGAVVMDEVHYINDAHRGHVWEQTIMTLPPTVQMVMLSATLDNPMEFAHWIERTRSDPTNAAIQKQVHLAETRHRIVPLTHYAYFPPAPQYLTKHVKATPLEPVMKECTNTLLQLQSAAGAFSVEAYRNVGNILKTWKDCSPSGKLAGRKHTLNSLVQFMKGSDDMDKDDSMLPAIVFLFSRKMVEECASHITVNLLPFDSKIPYNAARDCEHILRKLPNWREYAALPEYQTLVKLLEKGIGIHHSGMVPVLREMVELMISQKKIYLLFATESFAIGLDCPIRTAVFTSLTKFDGSCERYLQAHEYTQMAGRAGRRGIDTVGHVVHLPTLFPEHSSSATDGVPTLSTYQSILSGQPQQLISKFHIDYAMVLSLIKKGIQCSFHEFGEKSMANNKILRELQTVELSMKYAQQTLEAKRRALDHLRTPAAVCTEYSDLRASLPRLVNKKRKEAERKISALKDQYKFLDSDVQLVDSVAGLERDLQAQSREADDIARYMRVQCDHVCDVLRSLGLLRCNPLNETQWEFTEWGEVASHFAEIHPIPFTLLLQQTNWFAEFADVCDLVRVLAVFVNVRVPERLRLTDASVAPRESERRGDHIVWDAVRRLQQTYEHLADEELRRGMHTGIAYGDAVLCLDLVDAMGIWCTLADETECKAFLQGECVAGKEVSLGDFTKACMKISATAKEIGSMCEAVSLQRGNTAALQLAHRLREVDSCVLKYVATTQSIYL
jgi:superfamily II RNA helicase